MGSEMSVAVAAAAMLVVVLAVYAARAQTAPPSEGRECPPRTADAG